ncbi:MAG: glycogen/starch synthase, starch synthase [Candidatus Berkelbacteria bacterium]|nr:glycogen/starch synthase, starch synthase [Candidatus Berkelbacteria bacterium]
MAKIKYKDRLKVLFVTSEAAPLAKAGGLGDVAGSLPKVLARDYHMEVRIVLPKYKSINMEKFPAEQIMNDIKLKMPNNHSEKMDVYKTYLPGTIIPVYLLDMPELFVGEDVYDHNVQGRDTHIPFVYFSKAAIELVKAMDWKPDIIHIQDWMMGLIPKWLKTTYLDNAFFKDTSVVLTVHNIAYQGKLDYKSAKLFGLKKSQFKRVSKFNPSDEINILGEAILNSDMINTVSPNYARELLTKKYGFGLQKLLRFKKKNFTGILNGIDYSNFDPRTNPDTPVKYWIENLDKKVENKLILQKKFGLTQSPDLPLICAITRLTHQKGLDLIDDVLKELTDMGAQFIILGSGAESIEKIFIKAEKEYPKAVAAEMRFDADLAQTIYAGSDMLLMPSRFEPCGLSQIIAMRFGTIPIVRHTGGLADTVTDGTTGFVFRHYDKNAFLWAIRRAVDVYYNQKDHWRKMQTNAMKEDFSWTSSTKKYLWLYKKAIQNHKQFLKARDESK